MQGNVASQPVVVSVSVSRTHTFTKERVPSIRLIENFGVEGDAHAGPTDQHLFHIRRFGLIPNLRQVHLIHAELFDELAEKGHSVCPGDLGENIVTHGVDLLSLPSGTYLNLVPQAVIEIIGIGRVVFARGGLLAVQKNGFKGMPSVSIIKTAAERHPASKKDGGGYSPRSHYVGDHARSRRRGYEDSDDEKDCMISRDPLVGGCADAEGNAGAAANR
jgi:hypothetical protein